MATTTQLMMRSSIVGPSERSITPPDLLEQMRYFLFWKPEIQKLSNQGVRQKSIEAGWRYVGNEHIPVWFQTKWAANFARFLEQLRLSRHLKEWHCQPKTFRVKGVKGGYAPSFQVIRNEETYFWIEVNSTYDDFALWERVLLFETYYEQEELVKVDVEYKESLERMKGHIPDWED